MNYLRYLNDNCWNFHFQLILILCIYHQEHIFTWKRHHQQREVTLVRSSVKSSQSIQTSNGVLNSTITCLVMESEN